MNFRTVRLGTDFHGTITDFASARNSFLEKNEWVFFLDNDEEASKMLLDHIDSLKPTMPYYWIRRINLWNGRYRPLWNPELVARLVSNRVRFAGRIHEKIVPRDPHGVIDFPIIHNHRGETNYRNYSHQNNRFYLYWLVFKKTGQLWKECLLRI